MLNANDTAFAQVRLWQDLNQDGISQSNELFSLADKGITSIGLTASTTTTDLGNGNTITGQATVTRSNGSTTQIESVDLQAGNLNLVDNPFYREFTDSIPITVTARALPEMGGSGWLRDLREAMSLGTNAASALATQAAAYAGNATRDGQLAQLGELIELWAKTSGRFDDRSLRAIKSTIISQSGGNTTYSYTTHDPSFYETLDPATVAVPAINLGLTGDQYYRSEQVGTFAVKVLNDQGLEVFRRLGVLEAFNGMRFVNFTAVVGPGSASSGSGGGGGGSVGTFVPGWTSTLASEQIASINRAYEALQESVYGALLLQTRLRPYLDSIELVIDENGIAFDTASLGAKLDAFKSTDARNALIDLVELNKYASPTLQAVGFDGLSKLRLWVDALAPDSPLRVDLAALSVFLASAASGTSRVDIYLGDGAANAFRGADGDDLLEGGGGNDTLGGGVGNDFIDGGAGNDLLIGGNDSGSTWNGANYFGGQGDDTYRFGRGYGQDALWDFDTSTGNLDSILLKEGVAPSDVRLARQAGSNDLVLSIAGTSDTLTVAGFFVGDGSGGFAVERIDFADGTTWDVASVKASLLQGTSSNDTIFGYASGDTLNGAAGDDTLYGQLGDDTVNGGEGSDQIYGNDGADILSGGAGNDGVYGDDYYGAGYYGGAGGNDTLDGGAGNDYLVGGFGSDTYLFGRGDGQDAINNDSDGWNGSVDPTPGKQDVLQLKAGVLASDVTLIRSGDNLIVKINGSADQVAVQNYLVGDGVSVRGFAIEQIRFDDGTTWDVATVKAKLLQGTNGDDSILGYAGADTINGAAGNDALYGQSGDDTIDGEEGKDQVYGYDGADVLRGGAGDDGVYGDGYYGGGYYGGVGGSDTLDGGAGNDYLVGGYGSDTYLFGRGDGQDTINNDSDSWNGSVDPTPGKQDVLQFKAGVLTSDLTLSRSGDNLIVKINGSTDQVTISNYFINDGVSLRGWAVEQIRFADGTSWDVAAVKAMVLNGGTSGNDTIVGAAGDDTIAGLAGNDTLSGRDGNDTLDGGDGADALNGENGNDTVLGGNDSDTLVGGTGNDVIDGGAGNDLLIGGNELDGNAWNGSNYYTGQGNDTYRFGRGDGQDTIWDVDASAGNLDTISLKQGVAPSDVRLSRPANSDNLVLSIMGTTDTLNVAGFFVGDGSGKFAIEQVTFVDGTTWDLSAIKAQALVSTANADDLTGYASDDSITGGDGNDRVWARAGNDGVLGGAGNDQVWGEDGNDSLQGEDGGDTLDGGTGNDTLAGGNGGDTLIGGTGNDDIDGGSGNDLLIGGSDFDYNAWNGSNYYTGVGNDTYRFGRGDGQDTLWDVDASAGNLDTISLKQGVAPSDVRLSRLAGSNDLILSIAGTTDTLTVAGFFVGDGSGSFAVEQISFADGTSWNLAAIKAQALLSTANADDLTGYASADSINGGDGSDRIWARAGNDTVLGGLGSDQLWGEDGNDSLQGQDGGDVLVGGAGNDDIDGGVGNDLLIGGSDFDSNAWNGSNYYTGQGNDTYRFGRGDGNDTVWDVDASAGNLDTISLKSGVAPSDVGLNRPAGTDDLVLSIGGAADTLTVARFFSGNGNSNFAVEQIRFADGTTWDFATIVARSQLPPNQNITGTAGADNLVGDGGDDTIQGLAGNDTINGGAGNDRIDGGSGQDAMTGGADNDTYVVDDTGDTIIEAAAGGTDTVEAAVAFALAGEVENLTLTGIANVNGTGNSMVNTLIGNAGANRLDGGSGADVMSGGAGDDVYVVDDVSDSVVEALGEGTDTVESSATWTLAGNAENLTLTGTAANGTGNALDNILTGNGANNNLAGAAGNDMLVGGTGNDTMLGGSGNDTYVVDTATDVVTELANEGVDTVQSSVALTLAANVENLTLTGTGGINGTGNTLDNVLTGNSANNTLTGLAGNDTLDGGAGNDTLVGGAGNDTYVVNVSTDVVTELANEGTDTVLSSVTLTLANNVENLTLIGTSAINATGSTQNNVLTGNGAANTLSGGTGADTMIGGAGNDTYVVDNTADVVTELAGEGTDLVQTSVTFTLAANVENLTLTGTTAINATGNTLDNVLTGNSANNTLTAGAGNDTLNGGTGNDTMLGGAGNDTYVVNVATDVVTELANEGIDTVQSAVTLTLGANVENLTLTGTAAINGAGNTLDNLLTGNSANNTLTGAAGNDTLDGGLGNDTMVGGAGNDTYVANVATDVVTELANEGTDTVQSAVTLTLGSNVENLTLTGTSAINATGNTLNNVLLGNTGANVLSGAAGDDTYDGAAGNDTFTDTSTTSNETYRWGIGSGLDTLTDSGGTLDHVDLFAGITKSQLKFVKNGNNLELSVTGQTDKLTINSWYTSSANQIEEFRLADGSKVLASEVQGLLSAMAAFSASSGDGFEGGRATIQPVRQYTDLLTPSAMM